MNSLSRNRRVLFFVPEWPAGSSGILRSQVLAVAEFLGSRGITCLFVGTDCNEKSAYEAEQFIRSTYKIEAKIFAIHSKNLGLVGLSATTYRAYNLSRELARSFSPTHVYTRSCIASRFGRSLATETTALAIYDVRAALGEEVAAGAAWRKIYSMLIRRVEGHEIRKSNHVATVSSQMQGYIKKRYGRKDAVVIPSCYDPNRFSFDRKTRTRLRKEMAISDSDKVICYSGGTAKWQRIDDILLLFEQIACSQPNVRFLLLTPNTELLAPKIMRSRYCERYILKSCSHGEVPQFLCASDAGIIMRDNVLVNNVASPVKVAEYLACGLPIIMTKGIGDYSEDLNREGIGLLLDDRANLAEQVIHFLYDHDFDRMRERASTYALNRLTLPANWDSYRQLYEVSST